MIYKYFPFGNISRTSSLAIVNMAVQFSLELVNIQTKNTIWKNEMYLQFMDKAAWIAREKQGNASKYFYATVEILRNCSPPL